MQLLLCVSLMLFASWSCYSQRQEIEQRAAGLVYISEGNSSLQVFEVKDACSLLPSQGLEFVSFFRPMIIRDESGRWEDLVYYMSANLTNLKVYKLGKVQFDIYAVGCYGDNVFGLYFTAIET